MTVPPYVIVHWARGKEQWTFQANADCRVLVVDQLVNAVFDIESQAEADRRQSRQGF